jgi:hypothetical protein
MLGMFLKTLAALVLTALLATSSGPGGPETADAAGPPALVQTKVLDTSGISGSVPYTNPITAGNLLVVAIRIGDKSASATVTDNDGNAWQQVDRRAEAGGGVGDDLELWYVANASASPNSRPTVTVRSTVSASIRAVLAEYSGVLPSGPLDQHTTNVGTSTSLSVSSAATSQANELVIGYGEVANGSAFTPGNGYTLDGGVPASPGTKLALQHRAASTSGSQSAGFTVTGSQPWAVGIATFKAAGVDTIPPTVTRVTPANGAAGVVTAVLVGGDFSEPLNQTTVTSSTLTVVVQGTNTPIAGTVGYVAVSNEPFFTPTGGLQANACYTATFKGGSNGMKDLAGNALVQDYSWSFFRTGPAICSSTPRSNRWRAR